MTTYKFGAFVDELPEIPDWQTLSPREKEQVEQGKAPIVLRGLTQQWPLVQQGLESFSSLSAYLLRFDTGRVFQAMIAPPVSQGRLFYKPGFKTLNFKRMNGVLPEAMKIFADLQQVDNGPSFYIGSTEIPEYLPGLERENPLSLVPEDVCPNIWMGTAVTVATHSDNYENIACVAAGRRRFTLFPPEHKDNLYLGPEDLTPAGRQVSLVDLRQPDFERFPLFRRAAAVAVTAVLEAGDAIYIPTGWWHNVESLEKFNILVNYWWKGNAPRLRDIG